ncbi:hypothetical protein KIS4809_2468 [Bacillus sp. ZZV12-4809]|nr:hypothetical protein KIS4809_2468 [Bacillus sp. ZZV12-4809]
MIKAGLAFFLCFEKIRLEKRLNIFKNRIAGLFLDSNNIGNIIYDNLIV